MNARTLDKLHDSGNEHVLTVANRVNLDFLALDVLVDENRLVFVYLNRGSEVHSELFFIRDYLHCASAENE